MFQVPPTYLKSRGCFVSTKSQMYKYFDFNQINNKNLQTSKGLNKISYFSSEKNKYSVKNTLAQDFNEFYWI